MGGDAGGRVAPGPGQQESWPGRLGISCEKKAVDLEILSVSYSIGVLC